MIRPWYRSRLFWLGLPVVAALLWGWLASPQCTSQVNWVKGRHGAWLGDRSRVMAVGWVDSGPSIRFPPRLRFSSFDKGLSLSEKEKSWFPPAVSRHEQEFPPGGVRTSYLSVSYWLVLLVWLAVWLPGLWWWQQWKEACRAEVEGPPD